MADVRRVLRFTSVPSLDRYLGGPHVWREGRIGSPEDLQRKGILGHRSFLDQIGPAKEDPRADDRSDHHWWLELPAAPEPLPVESTHASSEWNLA